jgi:phenylacetate-coenzyme A ligase PaaK-like adenylate-forming protein
MHGVRLSRGKLHLNVDWYIVEPVDRDFEPVPPDQPSHTVLITNLANRVQPIIRYNLGDSITAISEPCSCGNKLPVIEVIGRTNDVLTFQTLGAQTIRLLPLALGTVIEETPGVHRFQAIQTDATTITVRLQVTSGTDQVQVWTALTQRLTAYLSTQGVPSIRIERDPEPPHADPVSGKYRQVWSEI